MIQGAPRDPSQSLCIPQRRPLLFKASVRPAHSLCLTHPWGRALSTGSRCLVRVSVNPTGWLLSNKVGTFLMCLSLGFFVVIHFIR